MKKLRIGVVGLGRIGWNFHCQKLAAHDDFDLVAVADPDAARQNDAKEAFGCEGFGTLDEMIASAELDAVVIATPTHLHLDMALKAIASGLHIILEKPMAPSLEEARQIAAAAEQAGLVLTVYQPHRHNAYFRHLKSIVDSGVIGSPYWVQRGSFSYARRNDWQALLKYGGGMLNNYGAHFLDQILQLIGYDIRRVFCNLQLVASLGDADDVVKIVLETEDGLLGECTINQASTSRPYDFIVWGTSGTVTYTGSLLKIRRFDPASLPAKEMQTGLASEDRRYPSDAIEYIEEEFKVDPSYGVDVFGNFAAAIRGEEAIAVPPKETLALIEITERCRRDAGGISRVK